MTRVHLVYPHEERVSCPDAIGRNLSRQLSPRYDVRLYDWDSAKSIEPGRGDVLVGHPHPSPWTTFRRSLRKPGWSRRLILAPFNHGDPRQSAWLDPVVRDCDLYLAITGDLWFASTPQSAFAHWVPKMVKMDLAVDRSDFPAIKTTFNPPGRRRFLFIGHSRWTKNVGYLGRIATALGGGVVSWMGVGRAIPGVVPLGLQDFSDPKALALVAKHDFLISVGAADANPAAVLEAMAWGLVPACSKESAHADLPGIVDVPLGDVDAAVRVLERLQSVDEGELRVRQEQNWTTLDERFTWSEFGARVIEAIESSERPAVLPTEPAHRLRLAIAKLRSPYAWWRPSLVRDQLKRGVARV